MSLAVIDRLVHHATILGMKVDSYRRNEAVDKTRGARQPRDARGNQSAILIVAPGQSNHASRKYRLPYRRIATITLLSRAPQWPISLSLCPHPDYRATA
ncbi:hypothetical protein ACVIGB_003888 [Bradyrhizobium sp. USDA 4341]